MIRSKIRNNRCLIVVFTIDHKHVFERKKKKKKCKATKNQNNYQISLKKLEIDNVMVFL